MKLNVLVAISILSVFQLSSGLQNSYAQEMIIEKIDLCDSWQIFNHEKKIYQKLGSVGRSKSIRFSVVLEENANGWLEITAPRGTAMLINGQYIGRIDNNKSEIELDSLLNTYNRNVFDFTLYRSVFLNHSNLTTFLYKRVTPKPTDPSVTRSSRDDFMNFYVLISLFILGYAGFLSKKFPRDILDYFSFQRSLSFKNREESLTSSRAFNRTNILFIILNSVLIGFLLVSMVHLTQGQVYVPFIRRDMIFQELVVGWIIIFVIVFFSFVLKYLLIMVFTNLFRLGDFKSIQHFNSLRFSIGSFTLVFLLTTITFLTYRMEGLEAYFIFARILVFLLVVRILVLFFKVRDYSSYRNFHLFSYLCATEIIPFIILYKLVLG